jgi:hypothetical protein
MHRHCRYALRAILQSKKENRAMASDERDASGTGRPPSGRRRRPPSTIEGMASEVASEPMTDAAPESGPAAEPPPASTADAGIDEAMPPASVAADGADAAPRSEDRAPPEPQPSLERQAPREPPPPPASSHRDARPWLAGAAAGLAAAVAVIAALWLLGAFAPRDESLAGKVDALDAQVRGLAVRPAAADAKALDDLRARVDVIDAGLRRVDDRLNRAESALATPRSAPTDPAVLARLSAAESMQRALNDTIADLRQRIDESTAAARGARERADAVAKTTGAEANAALSKEVEALAGRVAAREHAGLTTDQRLEQSMTGASDDRAVRLAVVAAALRAAVERGTPFVPEVAAAKSLGADAAALAPLEPFAASGVPSAEALARDLDKIEPAMSAAAAPPSHDGGILGRLQANAERLVRVRPVGDTPGGDPAAALARAGAKAQRGDIAGALAEVERLPAAVKAPAADWIKAAQARTAAIEAARQLAAASLAALGKASP